MTDTASKFHTPVYRVMCGHRLQFQIADKSTEQWQKSEKIHAAIKATGLKYAHMYRTASKVNGRVRIKYYAMYQVTNAQKQALVKHGFKSLHRPGGYQRVNSWELHID